MDESGTTNIIDEECSLCGKRIIKFDEATAETADAIGIDTADHGIICSACWAKKMGEIVERFGGIGCD